MKWIEVLSGFVSILITLGVVLPAASQVNSDETTNTTVSTSNNSFNILNGIQKGNNLFHSFKEFSIPKGSSAVFNNSTEVVNIINRVTGGNISNINGLIKANGNANLFLINPAGIVFGENSRLDIGGSFFGSTAESILFKDGFEFSAVNPQEKPLLTVSVPVGLQMGTNPGAIEVNGNGHSLTTTNPYLVPYFPTAPIMGLQVKPGNTLALIGGSINLNGGILEAPGGNIELGSVNSKSLINVNPQDRKFSFDYSNTSNFGDIQLSSKSLVNVSGNSTSSIQFQAKNISFNNGSFIWSRNLGIQPGGDITIQATELLELSGTTPDELIPSGIISETMGLGTSSNINVSTSGLIVQNGAAINSRTYTPAPGGSLTINATDFIQMKGSSPKTGLNNFLATATFFPTQQEKPIQTAKAGNITISTPSISMTDGSYISSTSNGDSSGGNIRINTNKLELTGFTFNSYFYFIPTAISGIAYLRGDSSNITVQTDTLNLKDGAFISTSNVGSGNASDLEINASESINVEGFAQILDNENGVYFSNISSTVGSSSALIQQNPNFPTTGDAGNVTIRTSLLKIGNQANVSVANYGDIGIAGRLKISADSIQLNRGNIFASAFSGEGGNIDINLNKSFVARNNSLLNTESLGTGNGGNLTISSPVLAGFENSDIIANAVKGNGGNIDITTQGIFGLKFREQLTSKSDITASSEYGVNGRVNINNVGIDPGSGLVELSAQLSEPSQQITSGCSSNGDSNFVVTGRGGIPRNPTHHLNSNPIWFDIGDLSASGARNNNAEVTTISNQPAIVEATSFIRNQDGEIELVATQPQSLNTNKVYSCSI
ncbi:filamentous hemagglutinin family N-terminal domain protein [Rivularia sp. PCC 7116]|uniref:beta strand repeat-containing protein n=1 Tax=Rivularia sp. PCC 7116 TaxID=373994 RepID=UPI00029EF7B5|nr:S-layer family protein [Rivularia sp. PCC 7116]AFY54833.1 filamentous hemagglutinin family N-terminal domain protein [Rivularia sp. PCC 7116]